MAMLERVTAVHLRPSTSFVDFRVLRARVNALCREDLYDFCTTVIDAGAGPHVIASQNLHGVHTYLSDPAFAALHEDPRTVVHIDGTPLLWLGRMKGYPLTGEHRTGCIDWVPGLLSLAVARRWRVFYLSSTEAVAEDGTDLLRSEYPGIDLTARDGYFDADPASLDSRRIRNRINQVAPDLLLVGMGMGRQERWILDNLDHLDARVIITTGAMMDLIAGELRMAPRWLGPLGLEWLFRLIDDTPRTAGRYLIEPFQIAYRLARGAGRA